MGEAQNPIWMFLKNFSNKFSISDHVNGNNGCSNSRKYYSYDRLETHDKGDFLSSSNPHLLDIVGNGLEKPENDKEDQEPTLKADQRELSKQVRASNEVTSSTNSSSSTSTSTTTSSSSSTIPFIERLFFGHSQNNPKSPGNGLTKTTDDASSTKKEGRGMLMSKKFTFSARVTNYQDDNGGTEEHRSDKNEDSDDSNWIEVGDEEDDDEDRHPDDDDDESTDFDDDEQTNKCGYCGCEKKYTVTKFVE